MYVPGFTKIILTALPRHTEVMAIARWSSLLSQTALCLSSQTERVHYEACGASEQHS